MICCQQFRNKNFSHNQRGHYRQSMLFIIVFLCFVNYTAPVSLPSYRTTPRASNNVYKVMDNDSYTAQTKGDNYDEIADNEIQDDDWYEDSATVIEALKSCPLNTGLVHCWKERMLDIIMAAKDTSVRVLKGVFFVPEPEFDVTTNTISEDNNGKNFLSKLSAGSGGKTLDEVLKQEFKKFIKNHYLLVNIFPGAALRFALSKNDSDVVNMGMQLYETERMFAGEGRANTGSDRNGKKDSGKTKITATNKSNGSKTISQKKGEVESKQDDDVDSEDIENSVKDPRGKGGKGDKKGGGHGGPQVIVVESGHHHHDDHGHDDHGHDDGHHVYYDYGGGKKKGGGWGGKKKGGGGGGYGGGGHGGGGYGGGGKKKKGGGWGWGYFGGGGGKKGKKGGYKKHIMPMLVAGKIKSIIMIKALLKFHLFMKGIVVTLFALVIMMAYSSHGSSDKEKVTYEVVKHPQYIHHYKDDHHHHEHHDHDRRRQENLDFLPDSPATNFRRQDPPPPPPRINFQRNIPILPPGPVYDPEYAQSLAYGQYR